MSIPKPPLRLPLQPELAFVVQLSAVDAPARIAGRVEHVASGAAQRFGSADELLEFLGAAGTRRPGTEP